MNGNGWGLEGFAYRIYWLGFVGGLLRGCSKGGGDGMRGSEKVGQS